MPGSTSTSLKITIPDGAAVTAKMDAPDQAEPPARALVLAHGSRNDLDQPLLAFVASYLAEHGRTTVLRFNFPYAERNDGSSDSAALLERTFKAAFARLKDETAPGTPICAGGKSLGGRVAAELVSRRLDGDGIAAAGLVELGYPLHAPGRTDRPNLRPLRHIDVPSLFCIGSRDPFCDLDLFKPVVPALAVPGELYVVADGDHSLQLPRASGRGTDDAYRTVAAKVADFVMGVT